MEVTADHYRVEKWVESIANATAPSSTVRIHRVPSMVKEIQDHEKYYVPKVVSIGPYYFGHKKLELVENLKPIFTMKLLSNDKETLKILSENLGEPNMVQGLRNFYEENSTDEFNDDEFTKMMLLDGCFILYHILNIPVYRFGELTHRQIAFVNQDLFLLENQIPFIVLHEVMMVLNDYEWIASKIRFFTDSNILAYREQGGIHESSRQERRKEIPNVDHLLHLRHTSLTGIAKAPNSYLRSPYSLMTSHNVNELMDAGIHFKPSGTTLLTHIEFIRGWWWCRATVKLPKIVVDDSTKPMLLNLIAFEMCSPETHKYSWVTSYVCLLNSLIDQPEDVRTLRKAGVLDTSIGSDSDVAKLFKEIGTDLVPNKLAYGKAKFQIKRHYDSFRNINTSLSQLKQEYVYSPWAFLAVVGGVLVLFLTAVQTYFTVWSPEGKCDDLCTFLKMNHHL